MEGMFVRYMVLHDSRGCPGSGLDWVESMHAFKRVDHLGGIKVEYVHAKNTLEGFGIKILTG